MRSPALLAMLLMVGCDSCHDDDDDDVIDTGGLSDTCYLDADGDGFGDSSATGDCDASGYVADGGDCDDADASVNPDAEEVCDGVDNDCSGQIDGADATDALAWHVDTDGDGYGSKDDVVYDCEEVSGLLADASDCNDSDASVNPDGVEVCFDGIDTNCDGADNDGVCTLSLADADVVLTGEGTDDRAGYAIASAGDMNSDGYDDVLVGARLNDDAGADAGATYLVYGPLTSMSLSAADVTIEGAAAGDYAGISVSGGQDYDGDGNLDILIGAQNVYDGSSAQTGAAYVVFGPATDMDLSSADVALYGEAAGDEAGRNVAFVGDVDADGYADVLVGARSNSTAGSGSGAAYLVYGASTGGALDGVGVSLQGAASQDAAGYWLAAAGDVDADGLADVWVNAYRADSGSDTNLGATYLLSGGGALSGLGAGDTLSLTDADAIVWGETAKDQAGSAVSSAGDVDGDGYVDVLIGAQHRDPGGVTDAGVAYLLRGALSGTVSVSSAQASFVGEATLDYAGRALAPLGDINDDGFGDFLIGAKTNDDGGTDAGAAYLILGPVTGQLSLADADGRFVGSVADGQAGTEVAYGGDTNGDGETDFLIGASGVNQGYGYLILGGDW